MHRRSDTRAFANRGVAARECSRALHIASAVLLATSMLATGDARAQPARGETPQATVSLGANDVYAGLPFDLLVSAVGFDEQPEPAVSDFEIPGCTITFMGASPNVSTSISIVNGRRSESRRVEYVFRYRVEAPSAGGYTVPAIEVVQGSKKAAAQGGRIDVKELPTTRDMRVQLTLPERPVSVGETFDVTIDWYIGRQPQDQDFVVPLFDAQDWVEVRAPAGEATPPGVGRRRKGLAFAVGDREIQLPYDQEMVRVEGKEMSRFRFKAAVTPIKPGTLELAPTRVVAELQVGRTRGGIFSRPVTKLFKVEDVARSLQIKPLPVKDRPASFAGAVGTGFSIQVQASRTVVKLGEPIELEIFIRGDSRMEGLSLPKLDNQEGLPPSQFSIADMPATGELVRSSDRGEVTGKRFRVTVSIKSPEVREVPRLAFSYYNPKSGTYETAYSQPIALSVEGSAIVGANEVVSGANRAVIDATQDAVSGNKSGAAVGAELALSAPSDTLSRGWSLSVPVLIALYLAPLLFLAFQFWRRRTRGARDQSSELRKAQREARDMIERARSAPAREVAPELLAALRKLAGAAGRDSLRGDDVIARIETVSYDPKAADKPLDGDILDGVEKLASQWSEESKARRSSAAGLAALVLASLTMTASPVHADGGENEPGAEAGSSIDARLDGARSAYQTALSQSDRDARATGFVRAESRFRQLAEEMPDRPELLIDWGNAALGAQDLGRATLAYRRALALDPSAMRAERNLSWVRNRMPKWAQPGPASSATDWFFFWNRYLPVPTRHLVGAAAFALAVLFLVPWARRPSWLRWLALLPAFLWLVMMASIVFDEPEDRDAVVMSDGASLLSADSPGASLAAPEPLPAGVEVSIVERRGAWTHIRLVNGRHDGWLQTSAIAEVIP